MSSPCSGSSELTVRVVNSRKAQGKVHQFYEFTVRWLSVLKLSPPWDNSEELSVSMLLAHTFTGEGGGGAELMKKKNYFLQFLEIKSILCWVPTWVWLLYYHMKNFSRAKWTSFRAWNALNNLLRYSGPCFFVIFIESKTFQIKLKMVWRENWKHGLMVMTNSGTHIISLFYWFVTSSREL